MQSPKSFTKKITLKKAKKSPKHSALKSSISEIILQINAYQSV